MLVGWITRFSFLVVLRLYFFSVSRLRVFLPGSVTHVILVFRVIRTTASSGALGGYYSQESLISDRCRDNLR